MWAALIILFLILALSTAILSLNSRLGGDREGGLRLNGEKLLPAQSGENLLSALSAAKIYIPSGCGGKATCGLCKVQMDPRIEVLPTEEPFLSPEERKMGIRLACQHKVRGTMELSLPEHFLNATSFQGVTRSISALNHDTRLIEFELDQRIDFKPGQFLQIRIPGTEDEFRAYSIASSPLEEKSIRFLIRKVPGGFSTTFTHEVLEVGDKLDIIGPFGDFIFQEKSKRPILLVAGGSGMAPIYSILLYMASKKLERSEALFFFGARTRKDLFLEKEMKELSQALPFLKFIPALSHPEPGDEWQGETGLITDVVDTHVKDAGKYEAYLCGSRPLVDAAFSLLSAKGLSGEHIYFDAF